MTRRDEKKRQTSQTVLAAARREFEEKGFHDASVRGIAKGADVSAGTVINHFGSKRELLYAALFDDLEATLQQALENDERHSLHSKLDALTRTMFGYYRARPRLSRTLLKESLFADPPWAEKFSGQVAAVHREIGEWASQAKRSGQLHEDTDNELLGAAYLSFFYFGLIAWVQGTHDQPEIMITRLLEQHLRGLQPAIPPQCEDEDDDIIQE